MGRIVQAYRSTNTNITYKDMMALKQFCKDKMEGDKRR